MRCLISAFRSAGEGGQCPQGDAVLWNSLQRYPREARKLFKGRCLDGHTQWEITVWGIKGRRCSPRGACSGTQQGSILRGC